MIIEEVEVDELPKSSILRKEGQRTIKGGSPREDVKKQLV